jgi:WD40 repeat protein
VVFPKKLRTSRAVTSIDAEMLSFLGRGKPSDPPPEPSPAPDPPPASSAPPPPSAPPDFSDAKAVTIELVAELEGHDDRVWGMQWEPRGRCLASTSSDKTCRLWSQSAAAGGNWVTVAELEGVHNRTVRQVSWSPCGARARARVVVVVAYPRSDPIRSRASVRPDPSRSPLV